MFHRVKQLGAVVCWGMRKPFSVLAASLVLLVPLAAMGTPEKPRLTLDPSSAFQTVEHFGTSAAWWAQAVGTWPEAELDRTVDLLFSREQGIGLSLVRYNLGGGKEGGAAIADPWRSASAPLRTSTGFDWSPDAAAVRVVDKAVALGAQVLVFANSPPASLTVTGLTTGNKAVSNLRPEARGAFAAYLADAVESLTARGWPVVAVSPMNEPQWDWQPSNGQEGSHDTPAEAHALLTALAAEWRSRGLTTELSAIDSGEWKLGSNTAYLNEVWGDPALRPLLTHYSVHSYWSETGDRRALAAFVAAKYPGLRLWQTEWTEMKGGRDVGMASALVLAKTVQDDLINGGVTSWQSWIAVSKYDYRDGLLYADEADQTVTATKRLWALGNWSRFVLPGARRIAATLSAAGRLTVSAFANPDGSLVAVLVNDSPQAREVGGLSAPGLAAPSATSLAVWQTSAASDLEQVSAGPPGPFELAPYSVTTLVLR